MNDTIKPAAGHPLALRNMLYPGTGFDDPRMGRDDQPADMAHMYRGLKDNGGVHINSGIPNRAWAVATTELAKVMPDKASWETTGYVWMHSMALLGPDATFAEAARATYVTAQRLFPKDPAVAQSIEKGWKTVGLNVDGKPPVSTSPSSGHPIRVIILSWLKNLKK